MIAVWLALFLAYIAGVVRGGDSVVMFDAYWWVAQGIYITAFTVAYWFVYRKYINPPAKVQVELSANCGGCMVNTATRQNGMCETCYARVLSKFGPMASSPKIDP